MTIREDLIYEPAPLTIPNTVEEMRETIIQLQSELIRVANALNAVHEFDISKEPLRTHISGTVQAPADPSIHYCDASTFDPGSGTGFYFYRGGSWYKIDDTVVP